MGEKKSKKDHFKLQKITLPPKGNNGERQNDENYFFQHTFVVG